MGRRRKSRKSTVSSLGAEAVSPNSTKLSNKWVKICSWWSREFGNPRRKNLIKNWRSTQPSSQKANTSLNYKFLVKSSTSLLTPTTSSSQANSRSKATKSQRYGDTDVTNCFQERWFLLMTNTTSLFFWRKLPSRYFLWESSTRTEGTIKTLTKALTWSLTLARLEGFGSIIRSFLAELEGRRYQTESRSELWSIWSTTSWNGSWI